MTHPIETEITTRYTARTGQSRANDERAKQFLPGGDTRSSTYFFPYPTYMVKGQGCYLTDADGNRYIDFVNNYTSLIHGHAHPDVVAAVAGQMPNGTIFGSAATVQADLAEMLCERIPGVEMVRFTNSGTEATMMAMRAARAHTGKEMIIKMDGGYHGSHDFAEVNQSPDLDADAGQMPAPHLEGGGIPAGVLDSILVAPFNDLGAAESLLEEHAGEVAAIMIEPMMGAGGGIQPADGYLQGLRQLADKYGVLLIFDEIITFRTSLGGMQRREGVTPDLTTLGKIIGGGFPIGAFGGRPDVMSRFDPAHPSSLGHGGTFNGHNIAMVAGIATLRAFDQPAIERLDQLGERLVTGCNQAFVASGIKGHLRRIGSLSMIYWTDKPVETSADYARTTQAAARAPHLLHLEMLNRGIFAVSRGWYTLSTPMTETEIDTQIEAFAGTLETIKPYIADKAPHLIR